MMMALQTPTIAMLLAGAANVLPALLFLITGLLGSNGVSTARAPWFLIGLVLLLALGWVAGLFLARQMARWTQARGWSPLASVAAASTGTLAVYTTLALLVTFAMLMAMGA